MATKTVIRRRPRVISSSIERVESVDSATPIADVLTQVAYVFFAILEGLLIARFVLRLAAANPFQDIVAWVYNATAVFCDAF